jgi:hypothetical protein
VDRSAHKTLTCLKGQAVIELTIAAVLVLIVVTCAVGIVATVKKEMKHDFLNGRNKNGGEILSRGNDEINNALEKINKSVDQRMISYGRQSIDKTLGTLETDGWSRIKSFKTPKGFVVLLSNGEKKMSVIKTKEGTLGVFL